MGAKSDVPDLPNHDDEYWEKAENEMCKVKPSIVCDPALHHFERTTGIQAECTKCRLGYYLPVESIVNDGHIYINGKFVI